MERLTFKGNFCDIAQCEAMQNGSCEDGTCSIKEIWERLKEYEDIGYTPAALAKLVKFDEAMKRTGLTVGRIYDLIVADEAERVVVLPCKVGDTLWTYCDFPATKIYSCKVTDINPLNGRITLTTSNCGVVDARDVGKTVFLTREEAEKALDERNNRADC